MKTKSQSKPVRKCRDCGLHLGDHCGIYPEPTKMWHHRNCPGYKNEDMFADYEAELTRYQADSRRLKRQEVAKTRNSEDHHQGTLPLANR